MENPNMSPDAFSGQPEPKKNNTILIVAIIAVILLCCCCFAAIGGYWMWNNGDQLLGVSQLANLL